MGDEAWPLLTRDDLSTLLNEVAERAEQRGVRIDMFLVGGAAMALVYDTNRSTRDLDGVFEPKSVAYEIAAQVARESGHDLAPDWLNDGVKAFLPGPDHNATVLLDRPGLTVRVASPRYLFVLKALAARESDYDDLKVLFLMGGFKSAGDALDAIEAAYPARPVKAATQYLVEELAQHATASDPARGESIQATDGSSSPDRSRTPDE